MKTEKTKTKLIFSKSKIPIFKNEIPIFKNNISNLMETGYRDNSGSAKMAGKGVNVKERKGRERREG